ncbi:MAG: DUF3179 domain-containing protein [Chitinophagales bacterium]
MYKLLLRNHLLMVMVSALFVYSCTSPPSSEHKTVTDSSAKAGAADSALARDYDFRELKTNFSKHAIPVDSIHDGGVSKNGIPAIDFPEFFSVEEAKGFLTEPDYGILLEGKSETRFYPFNILNWHEVVNDVMDGVPIVVTFCPLCASAIVYERVVEGDTLQFGVSGKLYESNLLMFDDKNESLWSQSLGEAVVGDFTGKHLKLVNSVIVSFEEVSAHFPKAKVLSPKTGFDRNYTQYPYADYMSSEELYFPVSKISNLFPAKEMMYVVNTEKGSVAFAWVPLLKKGSASVKSPSGTVSVKVENNAPYATMNGQTLPGYFSFWFSWYTHFGQDGTVWNGK